MTTLPQHCTRWLHLVAAAALLGLAGCSNCSLGVSTTSVPDGVVGVPYAFNILSHCGGDVWFTNDTLPPGISLNEDGTLSGTPSFPGLFPFTVGVFDFGSGETAFGGLALRVDPAGPTPSPTADSETPAAAS